MFFVLFVRSFFFLFGRGNFSHCFLEFAEGFFLGCVQFFWNLNNKLDDMGDIFGDIFGDFFGGGRRGGDARRNGPRQGANLRAGVRITFDDAIRGVEKELEITLKEECKTCNGSGAKPGTSPETCPKCKGTGQVVFTQQSMFGTVRNVQTCPDCNGSGQIIRNKCTDCCGT